MPSNSPTIISAFEFPPPNESQLQPIVGGMQDKEKGKSKGRRSVSSAPSVRSSSKTNGSSLTHKRLRRVKSAVDDGRLLTLSSSDTPWGNKEWGKSQYTSDYVPKRPSSPIKIRPASATRMHNPHPNDMFLVWRYPVRIHPHKRATPPKPSVLQDIQERFYDDYVSDERKTGLAPYEVAVTNVATIPFPGNKATKSDTMGVSGSKIRLVDRRALSMQEAHTDGRHYVGEHKESKILRKVLQPSSVLAFHEWLKIAEDEEKQILLNLIEAANSTGSQAQKVVAEVFNPEPLLQIHQWLQTANEKEVDTVMQVLHDIKSLSKKHRKPHDHRHRKGKPRHSTWPQQKVISQSHYDLRKTEDTKMRPHSATSFHSSHRCDHCHASTTRSQLLDLQRTSMLVAKEPDDILWHHKVNRQVVQRAKDNTGGIFHQPAAYRGQHFAIHPEWPIA